MYKSHISLWRETKHTAICWDFKKKVIIFIQAWEQRKLQKKDSSVNTKDKEVVSSDEV